MPQVLEPTAKKRNSYKLQEEKVKALHKAGVPLAEIAKEQGVAYSTVNRFIQRTSLEAQNVEAFKTHRADILARVQMGALSLQEQIIADLSRDGILETLTPGQKASIAHTMSVVHGTAFDKERLERGQSTQNHSIMTKMLHSSVDSAMKSTASGIVALPPGDHNIVDEDELPPADAAAQPPSAGEEAGRGDSLAADVSGHPTESQGL